MKVKSSFGVLLECIIFDGDVYEFLVRQPNGQPLAWIADENALGSYLSELRGNVIANSTLNPSSAKEE